MDPRELAKQILSISDIIGILIIVVLVFTAGLEEAIFFGIGLLVPWNAIMISLIERVL